MPPQGSCEPASAVGRSSGGRSRSRARRSSGCAVGLKTAVQNTDLPSLQNKVLGSNSTLKRKT